MASSILPMKAIEKYFSGEKRFLERGRQSINAQHIESFTYDGKFHFIMGKVRASMKNTSYSTKAFIEKGTVTNGVCTCARGLTGQCHHIAALLLHTHFNVSSTDVTCQWSKPKKTGTDNEGLPMTSLRPSLKQDYCAIPGPLSAQEIKRAQLSHPMCGNGAPHLLWLMKPTVPMITPDEYPVVDIPSVEEAVKSPSFIDAPCKSTFIEEFCNLSEAKIYEIAEGTKGQHKNPNWTEARRHRIGASSYGAVLANIRSRRSNKSLLQTLSGVRGPLKGVHALDWGRTHEEVAITQFEEISGISVQRTGVWLHKSGVLGASPDGILDDDCLLEIKCPFKYRESSLRRGLSTDTSYIIRYDEEKDDWLLNCSHVYYDQMQGQMYLTGKSKCVLSVWTPKEPPAIVFVKQDEAWAPNVKKLISYHLNTYLPFVFPDVFTDCDT